MTTYWQCRWRRSTDTLHDSFDLVQFEEGGFGEGLGAVGGDDEGVFDADVELFFRHPQLGIEGEDEARLQRVGLVVTDVVDGHADWVGEGDFAVDHLQRGLAKRGLRPRLGGPGGADDFGRFTGQVGDEGFRVDRLEQDFLVFDNEGVEFALNGRVLSIYGPHAAYVARVGAAVGGVVHQGEIAVLHHAVVEKSGQRRRADSLWNSLWLPLWRTPAFRFARRPLSTGQTHQPKWSSGNGRQP